MPSCNNTTPGPPGQSIPVLMVQDPLIRGIVLLKFRPSHNMNSVIAPIGEQITGDQSPRTLVSTANRRDSANLRQNEERSPQLHGAVNKLHPHGLYPLQVDHTPQTFDADSARFTSTLRTQIKLLISEKVSPQRR
jgi:hypothetical protein